MDEFTGNILFASLDQMEFKSTSRRDDFISVIYNLIYLLNGFTYPGFTEVYGNINDNNMSLKDKFKKLYKFKKKVSLMKMAENLDFSCDK